MRFAFAAPRASKSCGAWNALVSDLLPAVPEKRRPALRYWEGRLKTTIERSFADHDERMETSKEDRQGLGVSRQRYRSTQVLDG
jgi:hypothetical protein